METDAPMGKKTRDLNDSVPAREARQRYYRRNREKWKKYAKQYRQTREGQLRVILQNTKAKARRKGEKFDLTIEELSELAGETCPVLGTSISYADKDAPAIARKDSSGSYTRDNCIVVSKRAYDLLSDGSLEEFEKIVLHLRNILT